MAFAGMLLMLPFSVKAQEPDWLIRLKQQKWMSKVASLKLLKTNRVEAEKILGKADDDSKDNVFILYPFKNGTITLDYTTKECTSINGKVSKDMIERISFHPEADISFSKLKLPLNQFKHSRESDNPTEHYENEQTGIDVVVQHNRVYSIDFEIPEQMNFSCVTVSSFLSDLEKVKNLKLLESNRDEVRKLLADYHKSENSKDFEHKDTFYTGDASFEFSYSKGKCQFDDSDEYESAEWNVQRVKISPVNFINPIEFGINLNKYKKEKMYKNNPNVYIYYDKDLGISFEVVQDEISEINLFPSPKYNSLMCDKEQAKILSSTDSIFTEKLEDRIYNINSPASVEKIYLSQNEVVLDCNSADANESRPCLDNFQKINVFTKTINPQGDVLTYVYTVSGGNIIGRGEKVIWDLSGVKPGTYTITAAVDDGCGFCGQTKTKTVVVK